MKRLTNQEIFTRVKRHLLKQKCQAKALGGCRYRTSDDLKCAVGCLIPKKLYKTEIEGLVIGDWSTTHGETDEENIELGQKENLLFKILRKIGITKQNHRLLAVLQCVHDESDPNSWADRLKEVAKDFRLKF